MANVNASRFATLTVGGTTPKLTTQFVRPGDATTYAIGDLIANSQTAASVVPMEFVLPAFSGRLSGAACVVSAASGTIVLPQFDLLLFNPVTSIPFAAAGYPADNAALVLTAAMYREVVAVIPFTSTLWRNSAGGSTAAGTVLYQAAPLLNLAYAPFNATTTVVKKLIGIVQAQSAWAPGNVANTFDFALHVDSDL